MSSNIILASGSSSRKAMLENAAVRFQTLKPNIDEDALKQALLQEEATPHDIADCLAEAKARKIAQKHPDAWVIGSDQVLNFEQTLISKAPTPQALINQLSTMRGKRHQLISAAVVYHDAKPQWRHVATARMFMRQISDAYIESYVARNWEAVQHCVGGYQIEAEGVRLFDRIEGDTFTVQGMPLVPLLSYLTLRERLDG